MGLEARRHRDARPVLPPEIVGIYYVAQQVASLPAKLKTSFDPILGPVISRNWPKATRRR
jgi:O-antigen/teichoic acid export membrane protein